MALTLLLLLSINTGTTRANQGRGQLPRRALQEPKLPFKTQEKTNLLLNKSPKGKDLNLKPGLIVRYNRKNEERHGSLILASAKEGMVNLEKMEVEEGESIQAAIERLQVQSGKA